MQAATCLGMCTAAPNQELPNACQQVMTIPTKDRDAATKREGR